MRTVSVKQAAAALGLTERAIIYRLDKGQLKGSQTPNAFGKPQWRVYPTKEISDGLKELSIEEESEQEEQTNFDPGTTPAEDITEAQVFESDAEAPVENKAPLREDWQELAKDTLKGLAEELVKPLGETIRSQQDIIKQQQDVIGEKDKLIEEKDRQLKLLPDLEKRAEREREEAEEQRKAAHLAALEAEALKKQIEALGQEKAAVEAREAEALKKQIEALEREKQEKEDRLAEVAKLEEQVNNLNQVVEKLQAPWWKKWFAVREPESE